LREWASDTGAWLHTVKGKRGSVAIFPDDVTSRNDQELLAFICERTNE
jgi:hypothetical protein